MEGVDIGWHGFKYIVEILNSFTALLPAMYLIPNTSFASSPRPITSLN